MQPGDKCTVNKHYGHANTEKVMRIVRIEHAPGYRSGTKVTVDGLDLAVDSGLIVIIQTGK